MEVIPEGDGLTPLNTLIPRGGFFFPPIGKKKPKEKKTFFEKKLSLGGEYGGLKKTQIKEKKLFISKKCFLGLGGPDFLKIPPLKKKFKKKTLLS